MKSWSWPCAHFHQPLSQLLASAQCCAVASDTAPLVMLVTLGARGTCSRVSSFDGGTSVTQYADQSFWHAGDTCAIDVVTVTEAHGPPGGDVRDSGRATRAW